MRVPLFFLSRLYWFVTHIRNWAYDLSLFPSYSVDLPVICIGNLTVGGNGKTPICQYFVEELKKMGRTPVILSRGYKGSLRGPVVVNSQHTYKEVGDEPLLLFCATKATVVVAKDRVKGAQFIQDQKMGDCIILDDGYQHRRLNRNANIVCISISNERDIQEFLRGEMLPQGNFREKKEEGLLRADAVILVDRSTPQATYKIDDAQGESDSLTLLKKSLQAIPQFTCTFSKPTCELINDSRGLPIQKVIAACGLAKPESFFQNVRSLGYEIVAEIAVSDHKPLSIEKILARYGDFPIVCTEKDAVKFRDDTNKKTIAVLRTTPQIEEIQKLLSLIVS